MLKASTVAEGRVAQIILETAERGCLSRSTFDNPKTRGISCAHLAIRAAAGGTPGLRVEKQKRRGFLALAVVPSSSGACVTRRNKGGIRTDTDAGGWRRVPCAWC